MTTTANIPDFDPAVMMWALPGCLLAWLLPTDCLRSLENWPPFERAFRQYVGNPEAIYPLYDKVRQRLDGNYAFNLGSFYTDLLCWTGQPIGPKKTGRVIAHVGFRCWWCVNKNRGGPVGLVELSGTGVIRSMVGSGMELGLDEVPIRSR